MTKARDIASYEFKQPVAVGPNDGSADARVIFRGSSSQGEGWIGVPSWDTDAVYMYVPNGSAANLQAMKVTKEGYVTKPQTPSFYAYGTNGSHENFKTNSNHVLSTSDFTGRTIYNNVGNHFDVSNGRFTAPVAGTYFFSGGATPQNSGNNPRGYFEFLKNGASGLGVQQYYYNENYNGTAGSICVTLAAGDYVQARAIGTNTVSTSIYRMHFCGHLIG